MEYKINQISLVIQYCFSSTRTTLSATAMTTQMSNPVGHPHTNNYKPKIIGIYGVPGCGKSTLLGHLAKKLHPMVYETYDGSAIIDKVVGGGIEASKRLSPEEKMEKRAKAIRLIGQDCSSSRQTGIVARQNHHMGPFFSPVGEYLD